MMSSMHKKSFAAPDETRTPPNMKMEIVTFETMPVMRVVYEPGWRWSQSVKPVAGTPSCQVPHFFYVLSGHLTIAMDDGEQAEFGPEDVGLVPPGHDGWVVGEEPCVVLDFQGASRNI